jgi:hypothetical protein
MGHRIYLAKLNTVEYLKIRDLNLTQFIEHFDDDYVSPYSIASEIFNFGRNHTLLESEHLKRFFINSEVHLNMNTDYDFLLADKEFFKYVISLYTENIQRYYQNLIGGLSYGSKLTKVKQKEFFLHISSMAQEWGIGLTNMKPYTLDDESKSVTTSWKYEYEIFELIRLYKSFDWETDTLVVYGY